MKSRYVAGCFVLAACGGISDPSQKDSVGTPPAESTATISGALIGSSVPAGARVAVVWKKGSAKAWQVGAEAAITNGQFTLTLPNPTDDLFLEVDDQAWEESSRSYDALSGSDSSGSGGATGSGTASDNSGPKPQSVRLQGGTVSGQITGPFSAAFAGFVVYVDANGNNQLDLVGPTADSPDQLVGGNSELVLTYLRGGGTLDYEKLRDKSGILPAAGFNLAWSRGRWLPLSLVELKITADPHLPSPICSGYGTGSSPGPDVSVTAQPATPVEPDTKPPIPSDGGVNNYGYPDPSDPNLKCAPDGLSYGYTTSCPPPPAPEKGLCAFNYPQPMPACGYGYGGTLPEAPGKPLTVPPGWPCPIPGLTDGGIDAGQSDAGPAGDAGTPK